MNGLEALKRVENFLGYNYCSVDLPDELATIEKSLKALEIIKKKNVDVGELKYLISYDLEHALHLYNYSHIRELLTEEEFNLLKEVLE